MGADGSGKSTIADRILEAYPHLTKYVYMGASTDASNIALPTSRLLAYLKRRRIARYVDRASPLPPANIMSDDMRASLPGGKLVKALALINRVAEEWYRQLWVWIYTLRGYVVICDRHFLYEYFPDSKIHRSKDERLSVRLHAGILSRFYPRPDLTVFLDAPPEVLYARKPEWSIEHLERQRDGIINQGDGSSRFVRVDATQAVDRVYAEVSGFIDRIRSGKSP